MCAEALAPSERHKFTHNGRVIYEWDQTLTEVNLYVPVPAGVRAKDLAIDIQSTHLKIGIKGNPPYLDVRPVLLSLWHSCCTLLMLSIPTVHSAKTGRVFDLHLQIDLAGKVKASESYWTLGKVWPTRPVICMIGCMAPHVGMPMQRRGLQTYSSAKPKRYVFSLPAKRPYEKWKTAVTTARCC